MACGEPKEVRAMSALIAEGPPKLCRGCNTVKPRSEFYARRTPWGVYAQSRCKECIKPISGNPEYSRRYRKRLQSDPEAIAIRRDKDRVRARIGRKPRSDRYGYERGDASRGRPVDDPQPFLDWLRTLGPDAEHIGAECGIDPAQIRKYLSGAIVPTERTVDRAVTFAEQTYRLNDLLPLAEDD